MKRLNRNEEDLIEQYFLGRLSGESLMDFENKVKTDPDLQQEVEFQKSVIGIIKKEAKEELKSYIKENAFQSKRAVAVLLPRKTLYWAVSAAAGIILTIGVWNWLDDNNNNNNKSLPKL